VAEHIERLPNSMKALKLSELARERGVHDKLHGPIFTAYWAEGRDIGDEAVLLELAAAAGISEDDARAAFASEELHAQVRQWTEAAVELGAGGVPAWLVDERLLVPGAQPEEVFGRVMEQLGHEPLQSDAA
jgi:predicted DsbA family dithiol-disulfide isomerase